MSYSEIKPFRFSENGNAARREADAQPRVLLDTIDYDQDRIHIHVAGDKYLRSAHVLDAALDHDLVNGLESPDALKLGMLYQRARDAAGCEEKAAETRA